jgi:hypothetical protein
LIQPDCHGSFSRAANLLLLVLGILVLFCVTAPAASAQDRNNAVSTPGDNGLVKLPIVDQHDIRVKTPLDRE